MAAFAGGNQSIAGFSQLRLVGSTRTAQGQQSSRIHLFDIVTPGLLHDPHGIIHSGATHGHGSPTGNDLNCMVLYFLPVYFACRQVRISRVPDEVSGMVNLGHHNLVDTDIGSKRNGEARVGGTGFNAASNETH